MARGSFPKPVENYEAFAIYGPSILTSEGSQWAHYRRYTTATFNEKNHALVWQESLSQGLQMIEHWTEQYCRDRSHPIFTLHNIRDDIVKYTLNIICRAGFGVTVPFRPTCHLRDANTESLFQDSALPPPGYRFTFASVMEYISTSVLTVFLANGLLPRWIPRSLVPFFKNDFIAYDDLRAYLNSLLENAEARQGLSSHNLLEGLVKARRNSTEDDGDGKLHDARLSDDEILGNLYIFLIAGHETTSTTLRFALVLLATHPTIQDQLYDEINEIGRDERADISMWDYERVFPKLITPLCIMLEVLRLYPPVSSLPKWTSDKPASISYADQQYYIPPSTQISLDSNALHYNEEYWGDDAAEFDPTRWDKRNRNSFLAQNDGTEGLSGPGLEHETIHKPVRGAFLPFSDGVRACVGRKFAQVEFVAALVVIFREYRVSLAKISPEESKEQMRSRVEQALQGCSNYQTLTIRENVPLHFRKRD
ncbi:Eukaryotic translation initiation factor 2 alpha kinase 4 [Aspergillus nanangensis]|uniref:Eukaryotic translation initiation factor 2 alpha kinase 4 n=1 Tax=Aspergillus nanangensis TaxID=2582783 RepID=A0AAD4GVC5_ASPNN|nr:Eukaryotic translation initiation factor 2 alpha kinase 4 [Aspergillus nanangensis]